MWLWDKQGNSIHLSRQPHEGIEAESRTPQMIECVALLTCFCGMGYESCQGVSHAFSFMYKAGKYRVCSNVPHRKGIA